MNWGDLKAGDLLEQVSGFLPFAVGNLYLVTQVSPERDRASVTIHVLSLNDKRRHRLNNLSVSEPLKPRHIKVFR